MSIVNQQTTASQRCQKQPFYKWLKARINIFYQLVALRDISTEALNDPKKKNYWPKWIFEIPFKSLAHQKAFLEELINIIEDKTIPLSYFEPIYLYRWYRIIQRRNASGAFRISSLHHEIALFLEDYSDTQKQCRLPLTSKERRERYQMLLTIPMQYMYDLEQEYYSTIHYHFLEHDLASITFRQQIQLGYLLQLFYKKNDLLYLYIGMPLLRFMKKGVAFGSMITRFLREGLPLILNKVNPDYNQLKYHVKHWFLLWVHHQYPRLCKRKNFQEMRQLATIPFSKIIYYLPYGLLSEIILIDKPLYPHLGAGKNIRTLSPYHLLSKKMAHEFVNLGHLEKPRCRFTLSYLLSLDTPKPLAMVLSEQLQHRRNSFSERKMLHLLDWKPIIIKFIQWFPKVSVTNEPILLDIISFIKHCKEESIPFSIKGRTLTSMRRLVADWHQQNRYANIGPPKYWEGAAYQPWQTEQEGASYQIIQLTNSYQLLKEGTYMRHCVASYVQECMQNQSSIWSLQQQLADNQWISLTTLEINKRHRIIQAKAKYNASPKKAYIKIIQQWAKQEELEWRLEKW